MKNKTILITGGAGFVGHHLCKKLIGEGHKVICVDNLSTGRRINIVGMETNPLFEFINHDITQPLFVWADEIYNLACPASPIHYQADPIRTTKTSIMGAINMLGLAKWCGAKILQASTSEVYGDPNISPQPESYSGNVNINGPRSCYDEGKRCAESLFFDYHRHHGVKIKIARLFNTYGPGMLEDDGRVVSNFIVQALSGKPITIYGDGSQTRSFCYISDMIEALVKLMETEDDFTGPVNLGNPGEFTIKQLAEKVTSHTGSSSTVTYKDIPEDDPKQRCPDISLAQEALNWSPKISIDEGLTLTTNCFRYSN